MCKQIKDDVETYLNNIGVSFSAKLIGETHLDGWKCDEFRIVFTRGNAVTIKTTYHTGTGHRKPINGAPSDKGQADTLYRQDWEEKYLRPVMPNSADVLHSLLLDANAIDNSFEDWANDFGYDTDSRRAFALYEACCEAGKDMRKLFTNAERAKLGEMLHDF